MLRDNFFIIISIILLGIIGYYFFSQKNMNYINVEDAFEKLKVFLVSDSGVQNMTGKYPELADFQKLSKWSDPVGRFGGVEPVLLRGEDILKSFDSTEKESSTTIISGAKANIMSNKQYLIFSWLSPGVIDHSYFFYVDTDTGSVSLATYYQSPD